MTLETNGGVSPGTRWLCRAHLRDQLSVFVNFDEEPRAEGAAASIPELAFNPALLKGGRLELSVRSANCLKNDNIVYIGDLIQKTEARTSPRFGKSLQRDQRRFLADGSPSRHGGRQAGRRREHQGAREASFEVLILPPRRWSRGEPGSLARRPQTRKEKAMYHGAQSAASTVPPNRKAMFANMKPGAHQKHEQIVTTLRRKDLRPVVESWSSASAATCTPPSGVAADQGRGAPVKALRRCSDALQDRNGGYTRVLKAGFRYGDNAPMAVIEVVDRDERQGKVRGPVGRAGKRPRHAAYRDFRRAGACVRLSLNGVHGQTGRTLPAQTTAGDELVLREVRASTKSRCNGWDLMSNRAHASRSDGAAGAAQRRSGRAAPKHPESAELGMGFRCGPRSTRRAGRRARSRSCEFSTEIIAWNRGPLARPSPAGRAPTPARSRRQTGGPRWRRRQRPCHPARRRHPDRGAVMAGANATASMRREALREPAGSARAGPARSRHLVLRRTGRPPSEALLGGDRLAAASSRTPATPAVPRHAPYLGAITRHGSASRLPSRSRHPPLHSAARVSSTDKSRRRF